mmetsp:Transcript_53290/g.98533  ORF Transcript_53290/g.98533 Transcript_53290/m.98533 type:complete len:223 (-) Transcript_53290:873-1541(-)
MSSGYPAAAQKVTPGSKDMHYTKESCKVVQHHRLISMEFTDSLGKEAHDNSYTMCLCGLKLFNQGARLRLLGKRCFSALVATARLLLLPQLTPQPQCAMLETICKSVYISREVICGGCFTTLLQEPFFAFEVGQVWWQGELITCIQCCQQSQHYAAGLLCQEPVVTLRCEVLEVVGIDPWQTTCIAKAMPTASPTALLNTIRCKCRTTRLQCASCCMQRRRR